MLLLPEHSITTLDVIHCGDALAVLRALPSDHIDMALTSPPYDNLRTYNGFHWNFEGIAQETYRVLKPGGVLVWVVGDATIDGCETLTSMRQALYFVDVCGFKMHDTMIYHRNGTHWNNHHPRYIDAFDYMLVLSKSAPKTFNEITKLNNNPGQRPGKTKRQRDGTLQTFSNFLKPTPNQSRLDNVWRIYSGYGHTTNDRWLYEKAPAMFPEKLAERHILTWSNPGDIVLDFFMGSGTTAKMARKNGRHYIGCDISPEYVALARKRLSQPYTLPMFAEVAKESA